MAGPATRAEVRGRSSPGGQPTGLPGGPSAGEPLPGVLGLPRRAWRGLSPGWRRLVVVLGVLSLAGLAIAIPAAVRTGYDVADAAREADARAEAARRRELIEDHHCAASRRGLRNDARRLRGLTNPAAVVLVGARMEDGITCRRPEPDPRRPPGGSCTRHRVPTGSRPSRRARRATTASPSRTDGLSARRRSSFQGELSVGYRSPAPRRPTAALRRKENPPPLHPTRSLRGQGAALDALPLRKSLTATAVGNDREASVAGQGAEFKCPCDWTAKSARFQGPRENTPSTGRGRGESGASSSRSSDKHDVAVLCDVENPEFAGILGLRGTPTHP